MNRVGDIPAYFIRNWHVRDIPPIARTSADPPPKVPFYATTNSFARTNSDLAASEKSGYFTY
ncbi:unnamed protein product [Eruca vesicaria subsp. sativa]|uniref:Uncharacterized protein n=1 Tax=Eruca vesicaria subsp. sativa TaxID=29727 RepID=A0ABC8KMX7_ERUVS|nr:unnamed protein product [Eruca vesicaria subsp. sativa]